jgi:hypothetical protein
MIDRNKDILQTVKDALQIVEESGTKEPILAAAVFTVVFSTLSVGVPKRVSSTGEESPVGDFYTELAKKLDLNVEQIKKIFVEKDGDVQLLVKRNQLAKSDATATKEIALLISAGRQQAGIETETSSKVIRDLCEKKYGCLNSNHYAEHIKDLGSFCYTKDVTPQNKLLTLLDPGFDEVKKIIKKVLSI